MRILHIATRHRRGGAERNLAHTTAWEVRQGHEVHLAVGRDSLVSEMPAGVTPHLVPELVRAISPVGDPAAYVALRRLIRRGRFDLVHTHQSKAGVIGRLAARGNAGRIVHTIHMASFGPAYNPVASASFLAAERLCARFTDRIVCVGGELRRMYLQAGVGRADQFLVIRSPIEVSPFAALRTATTEDRLAARVAFGLDPHVPVALVVASLEPRKRVDLVIRELAPRLSGQELALAVAGDGRQRESLVALVGELGLGQAVRFLGHLDEVVQLMGAADLLVHAATVEGVPQVVIQALAAGVPVVATDMMGLREIEGAPIRIVPRPGAGLGEMVGLVLGQRPDPLPIDALEPWTEAAVDAGVAALHDAVDATRGSSPRLP